MAHTGSNPFKIERPIHHVGSVESKTLTGDYVLLAYDGQRLAVDPGGASRTFTLLAVDGASGRFQEIYNAADDAEDIVVLSPAAAVLGVIRPGETGRYGCNGTAWVNIGAPSLSRLPRRFELLKVFGERGKPAINADILSATEATREIADPDFEVLGTNGVSASTAINVEGGVTLTTAGASGDQVIVLPHLDASQTAWSTVTWGTDKQVEWECEIRTGSNITATTIWAGLKLTNTSTTATDNDQVFFRFETSTNTGKFQAIYSIGGTDTAGDSGVTVAVSTKYRFRIRINSARIARMYINDVLVGTSTALTDATDLIPYVGVECGAVAAKSIVLVSEAIGRIAG
jgi:hypothetical protein